MRALKWWSKRGHFEANSKSENIQFPGEGYCVSFPRHFKKMKGGRRFLSVDLLLLQHDPRLTTPPRFHFHHIVYAALFFLTFCRFRQTIDPEVHIHKVVVYKSLFYIHICGLYPLTLYDRRVRISCYCLFVLRVIVIKSTVHRVYLVDSALSLIVVGLLWLVMVFYEYEHVVFTARLHVYVERMLTYISEGQRLWWNSTLNFIFQNSKVRRGK